MNKVCFIIRDLLPLYSENLLSEETTEWANEHLKECEECNALVEASFIELNTAPIESTLDQESMFKKINRRLSMYQIIFVALSFFLAANTSMLKGSFGFILWYPVLGLLTYLFYKDIKLVFMLSFIPMFIWSFGLNFIDFTKGAYIDTTFFSFLGTSLISSLFPAVIHFIFAAVGGFMGYLIEEIKQ